LAQVPYGKDNQTNNINKENRVLGVVVLADLHPDGDVN